MAAELSALAILTEGDSPLKNDDLLDLISIMYEGLLLDEALPELCSNCGKLEEPDIESPLPYLRAFHDCIKSFHNKCSSINNHFKGHLSAAAYVDILRKINQRIFTWNAKRKLEMVLQNFYKLGLHTFEKYKDEVFTHKDSFEEFLRINILLQELGLLNEITSTVGFTTALRYIDVHVDEISVDDLQLSQLTLLYDWCTKYVVTWLWYTSQPSLALEHLQNGFVAQSAPPNQTKEINKKLDWYIQETYGKRIIKEIFLVVVEFPDTKATFDDLREILRNTNLRSVLVPRLKDELVRRVLHSGVATVDILTCYISTVRAVQYLDCTGVLLDLISLPVKLYLKTREDTVRSVVANFSSDADTELADELYRVQFSEEAEKLQSQSLDYWQKWMPDPIDAVPVLELKSSRGADLITLLINIYGSQQMFVSEYTSVLAERLLKKLSYDCDKDLIRLETLKKRLGESELLDCEVMLKDIADSRRIKTYCDEKRKQDGSETDIALTPLVLSAQYWPQVRKERLDLPAPWMEILQQYTASYQQLKGSRTLEWRPNIGQMTLSIERGDKTMELTVSPSVATVLYHFQEKESWTVDELAAEVTMSSSTVRRRCLFLQSHGIIAELTPNVFSLAAENTDSASITTGAALSTEEDDAPMLTTEERAEEDLQMYWSYVVGMLTNLDSMTLERLHSMLQLFALSGANISQDQLKTFLDSKVSAGLLTNSNSEYRLVKKSH